MSNTDRRRFVKTACAGLLAGVALQRAAVAADGAEIKFAKDPSNPQPGAETAHTPVILIEKIDARDVAFGKTAAGDFYRVTLRARHETTKDHHILGMSLHLNGSMVAQHTMVEAQAETSPPFVAFVARLRAGDELLAVVDCNLHGRWGGRAVV
jgi:desulfoferrodoxin (superoxide reductase-like protein)